MTVAAELSAVLHHSRDGEQVKYVGPRAHEKDRRSTSSTTRHGDRRLLHREAPPGILAEPGPQRSDRTVRRSTGRPSRPSAWWCWLERRERQLTPPPHGQGAGRTRKEEEARKEAKKEAKRRKKQEAVEAARAEFSGLLLLLLPLERSTPETQRRLDELHQLLYPPDPSSSSGTRRKRKKRRKRSSS